MHEALADVDSGNLVEVCLGGLLGIPPPLDSQTLPVEAFADVPLDVVSIHPHWTRQAASAAFASQDLVVGYWIFSAAPETLQSIVAHQACSWRRARPACCGPSSTAEATSSSSSS